MPDSIAPAAGVAASGLIAGATPFGWAQLGAGLLSGVAGSSRPAGPSQADSGRGGVTLGFDNSGWSVATGGSQTSASAGDRGGLSSGGTGLLGMGNGNIPWDWLFLGAAVLVVVWKKR